VIQKLNLSVAAVVCLPRTFVLSFARVCNESTLLRVAEKGKTTPSTILRKRRARCQADEMRGYEMKPLDNHRVQEQQQKKREEEQYALRTARDYDARGKLRKAYSSETNKKKNPRISFDQECKE
jgi:putative component of membrane protein insertase Oxa1/YidC/SpoIIIJ protein YidD